MNNLHVITSRQNRRIVEARKLAEKKHRQQQGRFLVEGVKLLETALRAGARPREVFVCSEQVAGTAETMLDVMSCAGVELVTVSSYLLASLA